MLTYNLFRPFLYLSTVVICLQTLVTVGSIFLRMHVKEMEWSDKHDLVLCREVLVMEPYQHPHRSKEKGDIWNQIAVNLSGLDHPKFKVNKRSARYRLNLLIPKRKAKIRQDENDSGITCEDTELEQALGQIIDKPQWIFVNGWLVSGKFRRCRPTQYCSSQRMVRQLTDKLINTYQVGIRSRNRWPNRF